MKSGPIVATWTTIWLLLGLIASISANQAGTPKTDPPAVKDAKASVTPLSPPALPEVRLATMPGFDDDAAYLRAVGERIDGLLASAKQADQPVERMTLQLAAVNEMLAHQLEPDASRLLLKLPAADERPDRKELAEILGAADRLLDQVAGDLQAPEGDPSLPADWRSAARIQRQTLSAFAAGLRVFVLDGDDNESEKRARQAASSLAPLREDANPAVAAAATLWQSAIRSKYRDASTAMAALKPALADPKHEAMPYALFSRFLRCRLLAQRRSYATALALLMQLEERCNDWLMDDAEREQAIHSVQVMRMQILADWFHRLSNPDQAKERQWCATRIEQLKKEGFANGHETLYRLSQTIPIIAPTPNGRPNTSNGHNSDHR